MQTFAFDHDAARIAALTARGHEQQAQFGVLRRLRFGTWPIPAASFPDGYRIRTTRPDNHEDCAQIASLLNAAFNRTIHEAAKYRNFTTCSPSYRYDLDLLVEAPDGTLVALVGVTFEPVNGYGIFEPVCTHPAHVRLGLSRALMLEGMRRLVRLGASSVCVDTGYRTIANAFYDSMGFTEAYRGHTGSRTLPIP